MSDYTQSTDFSAKDSLASGDPNKKIVGSDVDGEFSAIETAVNSKLDDVLTTQGDLLREGASGEERVALGSSGEVLQSDGTDAVWGSPPPITTQGDVITGDASGDAQRLALGTSGQVLTSDGTDAVWAAPGWEFIDSGTESAVASLDITGLTSSYRAYKLVFDNLAPATDAVDVFVRTDSDAGASFDSGASDYAHVSMGANTVSSGTSFDSSAGAAQITITASAFTLGSAANEAAAGEIIVHNPAATNHTRIRWFMEGEEDGGQQIYTWGGGARLDTTAVDAFQVLMSSGNISTMNWTLYGLRAS